MRKGENKFVFKSEVAKRLGIPDNAKDLIELYIDERGDQKMRLKDGTKQLNISMYSPFLLDEVFQGSFPHPLLLKAILFTS